MSVSMAVTGCRAAPRHCKPSRLTDGCRVVVTSLWICSYSRIARSACTACLLWPCTVCVAAATTEAVAGFAEVCPAEGDVTAGNDRALSLWQVLLAAMGKAASSCKRRLRTLWCLSVRRCCLSRTGSQSGRASPTHSNRHQLHTLQTSLKQQTATHISYTHCRQVSHHKQQHTSATHIVDKSETADSNTDEVYIDCKA